MTNNTCNEELLSAFIGKFLYLNLEPIFTCSGQQMTGTYQKIWTWCKDRLRGAATWPPWLQGYTLRQPPLLCWQHYQKDPYRDGQFCQSKKILFVQPHVLLNLFKALQDFRVRLFLEQWSVFCSNKKVYLRRNPLIMLSDSYYNNRSLYVTKSVKLQLWGILPLGWSTWKIKTSD